MSRDIINSTRLLRALSNLILNVSRDGASTTSLGNMCHRFTTLIVKNFFLLSSLNLPSLSFKPLPLVLWQQICPHLSYKPPLSTNVCNRCPRRLLQAEQPQLSVSSHSRGAPVLWSVPFQTPFLHYFKQTSLSYHQNRGMVACTCHRASWRKD